MFVIPTGFEPVTYRLEICCSIQLSYRTILHLNQKNPTATGGRIFFVGVAGFEPTTFCSQSRRDTGLRYTPRCVLRTGLQKYNFILLMQILF